jgi:molybdopterin-guanine dinucleotide biosynthesis protein A
MINNVTGIILAGGKSSRIGTNKAFLKVGKKTMIEEIVDKFKNIFREIIIITNEVKRFDLLEVEVIPDIIPSKGPLGGIYTGLVKSDNFLNFVIACDMPFLNQILVNYMLKASSGYDVIVGYYNDRFQPLCAIYSKNCIKPIENQLQKSNLKITEFFKYVRVKTITEAEIRKLDPQGLIFSNINTPEDYISLMR